jgi:hypothetical protein
MDNYVIRSCKISEGRSKKLKYENRKLIQVILTNLHHRFAYRAQKFINAHSLHLNGSQAAWTARKYRGHLFFPKFCFGNWVQPGLNSSVLYLLAQFIDFYSKNLWGHVTISIAWIYGRRFGRIETVIE